MPLMKMTICDYEKEDLKKLTRIANQIEKLSNTFARGACNYKIMMV